MKGEKACNKVAYDLVYCSGYRHYSYRPEKIASHSQHMITLNNAVSNRMRNCKHVRSSIARAIRIIEEQGFCACMFTHRPA
jgi:hypothetical protein